MKDVAIGEHLIFSFGAQAYNAFNHTNFDQPVNDISNPQFGSSIAAVVHSSERVVRPGSSKSRA